MVTAQRGVPTGEKGDCVTLVLLVRGVELTIVLLLGIGEGAQYAYIYVRASLTGPSSAFQKWSGHVMPKGSREEMFGVSLPRKNWIHDVSTRDFLESWEGFGLQKCQFDQQFPEIVAAFHTPEPAV